MLGTLRWLRRLDHVLCCASGRQIRQIDRSLLVTLRMGAYQLLFHDRVPVYAAVDEAVEQARVRTHRGGAGFVNAVLRRIARDPDLESWPVEGGGPLQRMALEWSHPDFLVERWCRRLGRAATRRLLEANNRPKPIHLLAFRDRGGREALVDNLRGEGCEVECSALAPMGLKVRSGRPLESAAFQAGNCYVQDEANQVSALIPLPRAGDRILDVAAAPGGKSFSLLSVESRLSLTMVDSSLSRMRTVCRNLDRLRRTVRLVVADSGRPVLAPIFDRVVVDLPCSGTGTLRKHPELKWRLSEPEIGRLAAAAGRLVRASATLVKRGGCLIVITCSLEEDENEAVVDSLLEREREFERVALDGLLPEPLVRHIEGKGLWRLWTSDDHDGSTVQVLRRG